MKGKRGVPTPAIFLFVASVLLFVPIYKFHNAAHEKDVGVRSLLRTDASARAGVMDLAPSAGCMDATLKGCKGVESNERNDGARKRFPHLGKAPPFHDFPCSYDPEDVPFFEQGRPTNLTSYVVVGNPRTGTSWTQEVSMSHPWIKVQFELDFGARDYALNCMQCKRPDIPNSKHLLKLPPRKHPPMACGQSIFGAAWKYDMLRQAGLEYEFRIIVIMRLNVVSTAISSYRHFREEEDVPWTPSEFREKVTGHQKALDVLKHMPGRTERPAFVVFYEDMVKHPAETFLEMQKFLRLPLIQREDLDQLHKKSSDKPSIFYLKHLDAIQRDLRGAPFEEQILDPDWDERAPVQAAFEELCGLHPKTTARWRAGACGDWTGLL